MPELRTRALQLLSRREHSRHELQRKLASHAESEDELNRLLDALESERLLSDHRYAAARVTSRAMRFGDARLKQELRLSGIAEEDADRALAECANETDRCRAVWHKKFGAPPQSAEDRARQARFLQYRGFSADAIRNVLRGDPE